MNSEIEIQINKIIKKSFFKSEDIFFFIFLIKI